MASFAAFAAGYLARPIGGIVLSHYGDRYGRRRVFLWSVFVMSGATLGMGLVPSYAQWGVAASALMVALRICPRVLSRRRAAGGAHLRRRDRAAHRAVRVRRRVRVRHDGRRGGDGCEPVAAYVFSLPADVPVLAWRIAFVLGGLGGVLSFVLRRSLEESPEFARMRSLASRQPFRELLRTHPGAVVVGCAMLAGTACFNGLFFSHLPAYLSGVLQYDPRQGVYSQTVGVIASALGDSGHRLAGRSRSRRAIFCAPAWRCCSCLRIRSMPRSKRARST